MDVAVRRPLFEREHDGSEIARGEALTGDGQVMRPVTVKPRWLHPVLRVRGAWQKTCGMLRERPREREAMTCLMVGAWSLIIFATIPVANAIQERVDRAVGGGFFLAVVLASIALGTLAGYRAIVRIGSPGGVAGLLWLGAIAGVFTAYTWSLRGNPEEAVHFVEYGVLGVLLYRAFLHRVRDPSIYVDAALAAAIVGTVDEAVQWLTPGRTWALRDVWLNFSGAALTLAGLALGVRPPNVTARVGRGSVRRLVGIAAVLVCVLTLSLLNTPPRIAWYSANVPGLAFARNATGVMMEYGHRYEGRDTGVFRSRFAPAELASLDAARGAEAGAILAAYATDDRYDAFLARYTPVTDPFVHEARVHLFRRDRILALADDHPGDEEWYRWHVSTAYRENAILERWFPRTLAAAGATLPADVRARLARDQDPSFAVASRVGADVVTEVGEAEVIGVMVLVLVALGLAWWAAREGAATRVRT